jgi:prephenate dehydrogenase
MDEDGFRLQDQHVCIVGLGLMGGSLALALRGQVARLSAVDSDPAACRLALERGIVGEASGDLSLVAGADVVILAAPVRAAIRLIGEISALLQPGSLLMDVCSVKQPLVAAMNALPPAVGAVAGHPMCGKEVSGLIHAEASLYHGARFVLCRTGRSTPLALEGAEQIVSALGAESLLMEAGHHDRVASLISHLPYLLAAALALTAGEGAEADPIVWELASSGFRDTSRLAGSDPAMMADILLTNQDAIQDALRGAQVTLDRLRDTLRDAAQEGDPNALISFLSGAQRFRREWERTRNHS